MNKIANKTTLLLIVFCFIIIGLMSWRWFFSVNIKIDTIEIDIQQSETLDSLDRVLQQSLSHLQNKPQLIEFFTRPSSLTQITNLWMDECEVTQKDFGKFRQWYATRENPPQIAHPAQPPQWTYHSKTVGHKLLGRLNMPASGISYYEAYSYCQAAGGRLPYSNEFEAISNSKKGNLYPWGNNADKKIIRKAMPFRDPTLNVQACGRAELQTPKTQIHDLGNNLLEWATLANGKGVLMGGNAYHRPVKINALNLIQRPAPYDYRSQYSGFRCVYSRPANIKNTTREMPWKSISNLKSIEAGYYPIGTPPSSIIVKLFKYLEPEQYKTLTSLPIKQNPLKLRISKTEINVQQYQRFLQDPLVKLNFFNHPKHPKKITHVPINWKKQLENPARPVTSINWWNAWAFSKWSGGRLPTDKEWKKIAGARSTLHPWGNEYIIGRSIDRNHPGSKHQPRGAQLSDDESLHGVLGLAGNVAEWTSSITHYGNGFHVIIKGGSYALPRQATQVLQTAAASPNYHNPDLGFRVVFP
jgi:formylglycine-generating enzyme required for sulfatase activity